VLSRDPDADASHAGSTDVSLLTTRTVAEKTIASLGLTMTPDEFLKSVKVESVSSELMSVTISAPSDAEAIRRLTALATIYLAFRSEQLTLQSNLLVDGMQQRIGELQGNVTALSRRIEQLADANGSSDNTLSEVIEQRAYIQGQIDTLRQSVEDAKLKNASVVASSRVIDAPATDPGGLVRQIVLTLASGFIGGAALGCGTVLFFAITSDRLRRRSDVAAALEVPVPVSVGRVAPLAPPWRSLPYLRTLDRRRTVERNRLAHAIEMELPSPRQWGPLGVVCIDNADEVRFAVAIAAANLAAEGCSVAVIDLTKQGNVELGTASAVGSGHKPTLLRPRGIPVLADGMAHLRVVGQDDGTAPSLDHIDVTLVVADLEPSIGADYLLTWTDRVLVAVTAGRSSAEMVRTAADLVRTAGLELRLAALLHTERTDDSSGTAGFDRPMSVPIHHVDVEDVLSSVGESGAQMQAVKEEHTAVLGEQDAEELPLQEQTADELTAEEETADELISEDGRPEQEQPADEEQAANPDHQPAKDELAATEQKQAVAGYQAPEQQQVADQLPPDEEQPADDEEVPGQAQAAALEELPSDQEPSADDEEAAATDQQATTLEQQPAMAPTATDKEASGEEQAPDEELAAALQKQPTDQEPSIEGDSAIYVPSLELEGAGANEPPIDEQTGEDHEAVETKLVTDPDLVDSPKQESTVTLTDNGLQPGREPEQVADLSRDGRAVDGWALYADAHPWVYLAPQPSSEDELDGDWSSDDSNSKQKSSIGVDDEVVGSSDEHSLKTPANGSENGEASKAGAKAENARSGRTAGRQWSGVSWPGTPEHKNEDDAPQAEQAQVSRTRGSLAG
jgi:capsular polysaccharide biosynthesis protein